MAAELPVMLGALADDLGNDFFGEEDDDFIVLAAAASIFARRNLNRILGYFEQTIATYSLDEIKTHFRMQRATSEIVVRKVTATGNIPAGLSSVTRVMHRDTKTSANTTDEKRHTLHR